MTTTTHSHKPWTDIGGHVRTTVPARATPAAEGFMRGLGSLLLFDRTQGDQLDLFPAQLDLELVSRLKV